MCNPRLPIAPSRAHVMIAIPSRGCRRSGVATIELLMSLPMLAALFMLVLTVTAAGLASLSTVVAARNTAWNQRNAAAPEARLEVAIPGDLDDVLRGKADKMFDKDVSKGEVSGSAAGRLIYGYKPLVDELPSVERQHVLFAGVWDGDAVAFDKSGNDRPLTLDSRFENFGLSRDVRSAFRELVP